MSKQKRWYILATLVIASLVLVACPAAAPAGGGSEQAAAPAAAGDSEGGREVVWMVRTGPVENKWEEEVVKPAWEKENPDIKLNILNITQDEVAVKREAMIAAGEPLDVWSTNWGGDGFASDRNRGLITDLTPLIERDKFDTSVFIPEILDIYKSEGKIYGFPFLTTGSYLFYNMKHFDDAGIPYPTTDWEDKSWTWDAALELAQKLTKNIEDPATAQYGWAEGIWPVEAITWVWNASPWPEGAFDSGFAQSVDFTSEGAIAAFQAKHDLVYKHKVAPDNAASQALTQLGGTFQSGRVSMHTTGGWGFWVFSPITPDVENGFCWGAAPIPWGTPDAEKRATIFTDPWVITAGLEGQRLEDAWSFIKFLVREDNARSYMQATNTPPTQTKLQEEWFQQFKCMQPEQVKQVYQGSFKHGLESSNHLMVRFDELNSTWDNALGDFWNDPAGNAAEVMPQVETAVNDVLTKIAQEEGHEFK